jgi:hypothetical protein
MALLFQRRPGENAIIGGQRGAIGKLGFRLQFECDGTLVGRQIRAGGHQAIVGIRLILRAHHQAVVDERLDALGGITLENKRIEAVERIA